MPLALLNSLYEIISWLLPFDFMQARFMQQALIGLLLLAPICAVMGIHVVNLRMAFFSDAVSHSAFAGVALGLLLGFDTQIAMALFAVLVGVAIVAIGRRSSLSADTLIGVIFSGAVAFGLAMISRERSVARDLQRFLYGDILTVGSGEIAAFGVLFLAVAIFQFASYNRLLYISLSTVLASAHRVRVALLQYAYSILLSITVIFAVRAVGVLLVTALLILPTATGRNLARSAGGVLWWTLLVGLTSAIGGLLISAQQWARTATGATVVLLAFTWFLASYAVTIFRKRAPA